MLSQAVVAVDAAVAFTGDPTLVSTAAALRELPADALPADLRGRLPAGAGAALQAAIDEAASADAAGLDVIIDAVRTADDSRPGVARFSFDAASASVAEGDMLRLTIRRDSVAGEASVEWRTRAETARGGEDFRGQPGKRVTFADGESSKTIAVETLADDAVEGEETFVVELSAPAGAELGTPTVVEVTLFDAGAPAEYFAPELLSARAEGDSYVLSWSHPQHPPEGGYDVVVDGRGTGSDWRTTSLSATVGPLDAGSRHCFMIEARYPSDQEFRRSNELCVDPGAPPPPGTGTATLSWTPPTERVDGSALDNLAGYEIYYGQDPTRLDQVIALDNPGLTTYVVEQLSQGTWHFGMKAVDAEGRHSALSNLGSKTFP
jgi:hypothetical protein